MPCSTTDTTIWQAPELGAELLRGRFADFAYDVHTHDTACFALLTHGAIRIRTRGSEFIARRGDLYAIPADEPHAGWPVDDDGWQLRTIYVGLDHLRAVIDDQRGGRSVDLQGPIIRDAGLTGLLYRFHRASEVAGPALFREECYTAFARRLFLRHARGGPSIDGEVREPAAVRRAREFLDQHLDEGVRLADVAAAAGLPTFRLLRAFSQTLGMTPHAYQRQARLHRARALIRQGLALSEVAAATGFADQAHLTRRFRRSLGITPGAYQAATR